MKSRILTWVAVLLLTQLGQAPAALAKGERDFEGGTASAIDPASADPWEKTNRRIYAFNRGFDRILFRPVARGYERVTPPLLRRGIRNFFDNLQQPLVALNLVLQGHPVRATGAVGRFAMNATLGLGGVLDPSDEARIPEYSADFGQTLSQWGWKQSPYMVLPVFGPSTLRDTLGKAAHSTVSPVSWLARREGAEISFVYGIDARARALTAEAFLEDAPDEYALVRDGYLQYRKCQIVDCTTELPEYLSPDYDFEIPDFEAIRSE